MLNSIGRFESSSQWESEDNVTLWVTLFTIIVAYITECITGIDLISVKEDYPIQGLSHAELILSPPWSRKKNTNPKKGKGKHSFKDPMGCWSSQRQFSMIIAPPAGCRHQVHIYLFVYWYILFFKGAAINLLPCSALLKLSACHEGLRTPDTLGWVN